MSIAREFKDFILRGSVIDLAVGVVIGAAFTGVVNSFVKDLLTPLISLPGKVNFSEWKWRAGGSTFLIGDFVNAVVSFLIVAFVVFFFVVKPVNHLMTRMKPKETVEPTTRECPYCLTAIPKRATRCAACASPVEPV